MQCNIQAASLAPQQAVELIRSLYLSL